MAGDRDGWPCFSMAGDGVRVDGFPVVWAPGQPAIEFPRDSGVPVTTRHKLVLQIHYNLANHPTSGVADRTLVRLRFAERVSRVGAFVIVDPLLESLTSEAPLRLPPGEASVQVSFRRSVRQVGAGSIPFLELEGVMAHMHGRARRYRFEVGAAPSAACALDIPEWDPHWQRLYFYAQPRPVAFDTLLGATCDYDTSGDTEPVSPGWSIADEMCATILYFSAPNLGAL